MSDFSVLDLDSRFFVEEDISVSTLYELDVFYLPFDIYHNAFGVRNRYCFLLVGKIASTRRLQGHTTSDLVIDSLFIEYAIATRYEGFCRCYRIFLLDSVLIEIRVVLLTIPSDLFLVATFRFKNLLSLDEPRVLCFEVFVLGRPIFRGAPPLIEEVMTTLGIPEVFRLVESVCRSLVDLNRSGGYCFADTGLKVGEVTLIESNLGEVNEVKRSRTTYLVGSRSNTPRRIEFVEEHLVSRVELLGRFEFLRESIVDDSRLVVEYRHCVIRSIRHSEAGEVLTNDSE